MPRIDVTIGPASCLQPACTEAAHNICSYLLGVSKALLRSVGGYRVWRSGAVAVLFVALLLLGPLCFLACVRFPLHQHAWWSSATPSASMVPAVLSVPSLSFAVSLPIACGVVWFIDDSRTVAGVLCPGYLNRIKVLQQNVVAVLTLTSDSRGTPEVGLPPDPSSPTIPDTPGLPCSTIPGSGTVGQIPTWSGLAHGHVPALDSVGLPHPSTPDGVGTPLSVIPTLRVFGATPDAPGVPRAQSREPGGLQE